MVAVLVGWVYQSTSSVTQVALLMVIRLVPPIVGGGVAASIVDRLPDKASRELAFGLAASVIVVDGRTPMRELNILKALQDMFDLSEEEVARLFETAQSHGEFPPTKGK